MGHRIPQQLLVTLLYWCTEMWQQLVQGDCSPDLVSRGTNPPEITFHQNSDLRRQLAGPAQDSQASDHQGRPRKLGRPFHVTLALLKNEHCPENPTRIMCRGLAKQGIVKLPGYEPAPVVPIVAK